MNTTAHISNETIITLDHLQRIESSIIASMLKSEELFEKITTCLTSEDFIFQNHACIMDTLVKLPYIELIEGLSSNFHKYGFAKSFLEPKSFVDANIFYLPLLANPSENIDADIQELLHYSKQKQKAIELNNYSEEKCTITFTLVSIYGFCTATYTHDRLCKFHLSNLLYLPDNFCDTFSLTLDQFMPIIDNLQVNETSFSTCHEDPIGEGTMILKFDVKELHKAGLYNLF